MTIRILRQGIAMFMVLVVIMAMSWTMPHDTEARNVRNNTRTNVNRNLNSNRNVNVNCNRNVNCNINVNRDVDIDVDHHYGGYHPVATAVGVAAAATITAAVVGSIVYSFQNCGGTWYQPQYMGTQVSYVVVNPPRY
jgi:hypothetical protein